MVYNIIKIMYFNLIESIRYYFQKHTIVFLIGITILMFGLRLLFSYLLNPIQGQCIVAAIILIGILFFGYLDKLGFRKENILRGLRYTSPILIISLYALILSVVYIKRYELNIPRIYRIVSIAFQMISIAFFEEILWRGIFINIIIYRFNETRKGIYFAVIISSVFFGLSHLMNLIIMPSALIGIISQVIYTTVIGILFSIVYIKYRNIWSVIIIHALFNLVNIFPFIFLPMNYWLISTRFYDLHSRPLIALVDNILTILGLFYVLYLFKKLEINNNKKK